MQSIFRYGTSSCWNSAAAWASPTSCLPRHPASTARKRCCRQRKRPPANPCSPYALTKLHGEQWGRLYARLHGLSFMALRFFSVWGPGQRPDLALEAFRRRIEAGQPVVINGDGTQRRDLTHVADVGRAVELALRWPGPGSAVLNVGTGKNHSVMDMLAAARKAATPLVEHQAPHPADVPETLASNTAAGVQIGWKPRIFFPDGADS